MDILGAGQGPSNEVGGYAEQTMLAKVAEPLTLEQQLTLEIDRTERRLNDMKAALEVLKRTPDYEVLFRGTNALHRNY